MQNKNKNCDKKKQKLYMSNKKASMQTVYMQHPWPVLYLNGAVSFGG